MESTTTMKIYIPSTSINSLTVKIPKVQGEAFNIISFLKQRIKKKMGWPLHCTNLICNGKPLTNANDIQQDHKIFALLTNFNELQKKTYFIYYKLFKQGNKHPTVYPIKVHGGMTINDLKQALINDGNLKQDDLSEDTTRIIYRGKLLSGNFCLMQESIKSGCNIVVFSRKRIKKNVKVIIKYPTNSGYNILSETFDKTYMCGTVKLFLHHTKRIPSKYPPFIFLMKNEKTGKVILDNESFEKQNVKDNDCFSISYRGAPDLFNASGGGQTLLSSHMKKNFEKDSKKKEKNCNSKRSKKLKKENKSLFSGFKKGFFNGSNSKKKKKKTKTIIGPMMMKKKTTTNYTTAISTKPSKLKPIQANSISSTHNIPLTNKNILKSNRIGSPIICCKNKENVYSFKSVNINNNNNNSKQQQQEEKNITQKVNMITINDENDINVSIRDKITNAKQSIQNMKKRISKLKSENVPASQETRNIRESSF